MARPNFVRAAAVAAALLVPVAAPAAASAAGTASVSFGSLYVYGGSGDSNYFKLTLSGANVIVEDSTSLTLTAGAGCTQVASYKVSCASASISDVTVASGDQGDIIDVNLPIDTVLYGSSGDDILQATGGAAYSFGGGSGTDTANYQSQAASVFASINNNTDDGPFDGGWDYVGSDIEQLVGGSYGDVLIGSDTTRSALLGNGGNDLLTAGTAGADILGGSGNDSLRGDSGSDWISSGSGTDSIDAKGGDDTIYSKDGIAETVNCGTGTDEITADATDSLTGCEVVHF